MTAAKRYKEPHANGVGELQQCSECVCVLVDVTPHSLCSSDGSLCSLFIRRPLWQHVLLYQLLRWMLIPGCTVYAVCSLACRVMRCGWYSKSISLHGLILLNLVKPARWYGQNALGRPVCTSALLPTWGGWLSHTCTLHCLLCVIYWAACGPGLHLQEGANRALAPVIGL